MAGSSSQLTEVNHSSASSSPLAYFLGIIDTQASLFLYYSLSPPHLKIFLVFLSSYVLELFILLLF